jgi:hypothetical protein
MDVIDRVPGLDDRAGHLRQEVEDAWLRRAQLRVRQRRGPAHVADWRRRPKATLGGFT